MVLGICKIKTTQYYLLYCIDRTRYRLNVGWEPYEIKGRNILNKKITYLLI